MTNKHLDFSLVLTCYNEELIIKQSVEYIFQVLNRSIFSYEIIFVDDASTDSTKKIIQKLCSAYPQRCQALYHATNKGRGASVKDGLLVAKGKVVGYIDIDCEVSPLYIPEAIEFILHHKADVLIGKRIYRTSFHSLFREILSIGYKLLTNFLLGTKYIDTESGYKFFNRKKILPILSYADHPHWFWDTQIVVLALRKKLQVVELPVLFLRRFDKSSSIRVIPDIIDYFINIWRFSRKLKNNTLFNTR